MNRTRTAGLAVSAAAVLTLGVAPLAFAQPAEPDLRALVCAATVADVGDLLAANAAVQVELAAYLDGLVDGLSDPATPLDDAQIAADCDGQGGVDPTTDPTATPTPTGTPEPSGAPTTLPDPTTEPDDDDDPNPVQFPDGTPDRAPETGGY